MGPKRNNNKKKKGRGQRTPPQSTTPTTTFSVEELTEAASVAWAQQEVDTAVALYTAALDAQEAPFLERTSAGCSTKRHDLILERINLLDKRAEAKTAVGDPDGAREDYEAALALHKTTETLQSDAAWYERTATFYSCIGQTSTGHDALAAYEKALSLLESSVLPACPDGSTAQLSDVTQQLASVCCSAAEVFLTDLCEEPDAEEQCEKWVQKALGYQVPVADADSSSTTDPKEPTVDALQLLANLRISQCRGSEALPIIMKAYSRIENACRSLARLVDISPHAAEADDDDSPSMDQALELPQVEAAQALPGFEFRCQMAKIMLESAAVSKDIDEKDRLSCRHAAVYVLGSLMAENDEVVEVWGLLGDAFYAISLYDEAASHWQNAIDMLKQVKRTIEENMQLASSSMELTDDPEAADKLEDELQQEMDDVLCRMEDLEQKIAELNSAPQTDNAVPMQE